MTGGRVKIGVSQEGEALIPVKAVPGARREGIAGALGDRLKVRVSAPAEGGKANRAIEAVLAEALGVSAASVRVVRGASSPEKTVAVHGMTAADVARRLGLAT